MIKHIVMFKFKAEAAEADREGFLQMLRAMNGRIAGMVELQAGRDVVRQARSFDLALVSTFQDLNALGVYAKHELHQPVIKRAGELCSDIVAVDYEA